MNRSNRLQPVVQFAHRKEKDAAQELGNAQQQSLQEQTKLVELQKYREEYIADFQRRGRAGVSGAAMQQFQQFLTRLDDAISQQLKRVNGAGMHVQQKSEQWQEKLTRSRALNNAVGNLKRQEQQALDKQEQKDADDRNARRHRK